MDDERFYDTMVQDEDRSNERYNDNRGNPTIGIGHEMSKNVTQNVIRQVTNNPNYNGGAAPLPADTQEISTALVNEIFRDDRNDAIDDAVAFLRGRSEYDGLSDARQEVLVNMAFNMGRGRLDGFNRFRQALQDENYERAVQEMLDSD